MRSFLKKISLISLLVLPLLSTIYAAEKPEVTSNALKSLIYYPNYQLNAQSVALQNSAITPQISGHIQSVSVKLGDKIKKGAKLATLDCTIHKKNRSIAKAQRKQIQNQLDLQKKQLARQSKLLKTQNISQTIIEQNETKIAISQASLQEQDARIESLEYSISLCHIRAPFNGTIIKKNAEIGQSASPSVALFTLLNTNKTHIQANIPQHFLNQYRQAKVFNFINNKQSFSLTKEFIVPQFNQNRTIEARLKPNKAITVGTHGIIQWRSSTPHLPAQYLRRHKDKLGVYFIQDSRIAFHLIENAQEGRENPIHLPLDALVITNKGVLTVGANILAH